MNPSYIVVKFQNKKQKNSTVTKEMQITKDKIKPTVTDLSSAVVDTLG